MKYRSSNNLYVHNEDPVRKRRNKRTIKNLIYGGLAFFCIGAVGKGCYDLDIESSTDAARYYSDNYLQRAKTEMAAGNTQKAKQIAQKGYRDLERELKSGDAIFRSKECIAIGDSLYDLSQLK